LRRFCMAIDLIQAVCMLVQKVADILFLTMILIFTGNEVRDERIIKGNWEFEKHIWSF